MATYQFVNEEGVISEIDYSEAKEQSEIELILHNEWVNLDSYFPSYSFDLEKIDGYVYKASINGEGIDDSFKDIRMLYMLTTPGGREKLFNEQRIQPTGDAMRSIFSFDNNSQIAVMLGLYVFGKAKVFCAWTVTNSTATVTTSKQIKIETIQAAIRNGIALQEKSRDTDYACAFKPEFLMFYLKNHKKIHRNDFAQLTMEDEIKTKGFIDLSKVQFYRNDEQTIYYGVPGSGKSYRIDELTSDPEIKPFQKRRVVFHPDYSNADFVGQIMPIKKGDSISYAFKEGPFTSILKDACSIQNADKPFYLIIEEINRGNAAAIFGDIFQLLDRKEDGWSRYEITNEEVSKIVFKDAEERGYKIQLPPNLSILATMNTSDQNVFTLDNAFQRRWNMVHIKNTFGEDDESKRQRDAIIEGTTLTWGQFLFGSSDGKVEGINTIISDSVNKSGMSSLEDKRLGCWFTVNTDGIITKKDFSNKILKYLWDDAFHLDKDVFDEGIKSFDVLVSSFEEKKPLFKNLPIQYTD